MIKTFQNDYPVANIDLKPVEMVFFQMDSVRIGAPYPIFQILEHPARFENRAARQLNQ